MTNRLIAGIWFAIMFSICQAILTPTFYDYAKSVCFDFDYNDIPFPGEYYWVKTCSELF